MGKCLIDSSPLFRDVLMECDKALATLALAPSWSIIDELSKPKEESRLNLAEFSQPLCTAVQLALVALLHSWGLEPDTVVGHSSGEIAAASAAGYLSLHDAIAIAYYRGLALSNALNGFSQTTVKGTMCAIGLGEKDTRAFIEGFADRVQLAAVNSPSSCTLSGPVQSIEEIIDKCAQQAHFCRKLRVNQGSVLHLKVDQVADLRKPTIRAICFLWPPITSAYLTALISNPKDRPGDVRCSHR